MTISVCKPFHIHQIVALLLVLWGCLSIPLAAKEPVDSKQGKSIHVDGYLLPPSGLLPAETLVALAKAKEKHKDLCPFDWRNPDVTVAQVVEWRLCLKQGFSYLFKQYREMFDVTVKPEMIAGVYTDIVLPKQGVSEKNKNRVLINLHGGAFMIEARENTESIPIAATGKIKVVSVDYRMSPETKFPSGVDDVTAVYKELLKQYEPENIGIYGASAGGVLTALAVVRFQREGLPRPGAISMINGSVNCMMPWDKGDSVYMISALDSSIYSFPADNVVYADSDNITWMYFQDVDMERNNPLIYPGRYPEVMAKFPPSLLLDTNRGFTMSSTILTHSQLIKQGVDADLHIWEGLDHYAIYNSELTETQDAYDIIVKFFDKNLRH